MLGYERAPSPAVFSLLISASLPQTAAAQEGNCWTDPIPCSASGPGRSWHPTPKEIPGWNDSSSRIVIVNNSASDVPFPALVTPCLGVLHGAEILQVPEGLSPRVINSTMFVPASQAPAGVEEAELIFLTTEAISGSLL